MALNTCEGRVIQLEKKIFIERRDRGTTTELFDLELDRNQEQRKVMMLKNRLNELDEGFKRPSETVFERTYVDVSTVSYQNDKIEVVERIGFG